MTIDGTKKALEGVVFQVKGSDKSAVSDNKGRFEIGPLSSGKYVLLVSKEG